jgi:hypothetical protein
MPPTKLPPEHHIVRHASWAKLRKDENDNVIGVLGEAFRMRPVDTYLSTTSLEYFPGDRQAQTVAAVHAMRASRLAIPKRSGFAIGQVQKIKATCTAKRHNIRIVHEPADDNKAHVAVRRFPQDDMELFQLLAADAWSHVVLNADVPEGAVAAPDRPAPSFAPVEDDA